MRRFLPCIATIVLLGAVGCDSSVSEGTVDFKPTDTNTAGFEEMKKHMMGQVKGPTPKKGAADKKAAAAAPEKPADAAPEKTD